MNRLRDGQHALDGGARHLRRLAHEAQRDRRINTTAQVHNTRRKFAFRHVLVELRAAHAGAESETFTVTEKKTPSGNRPHHFASIQASALKARFALYSASFATSSGFIFGGPPDMVTTSFFLERSANTSPRQR